MLQQNKYFTKLNKIIKEVIFSKKEDSFFFYTHFSARGGENLGQRSMSKSRKQTKKSNSLKTEKRNCYQESERRNARKEQNGLLNEVRFWKVLSTMQKPLPMSKYRHFWLIRLQPNLQKRNYAELRAKLRRACNPLFNKGALIHRRRCVRSPKALAEGNRKSHTAIFCSVAIFCILPKT